MATLQKTETSQTQRSIASSTDGPIVEAEEALTFTWPAILEYAKTRFTSLTHLHLHAKKDLNPFPALSEMSLYNWNFFFMGFVAWFSASFDFFLTAVSGTFIAKSLDVSTADITWGLSAVLMVRSAGAVIFGLWTDNYSRKWPFITTAAMFCALQIGTGFCSTYQQFMAVRAISGIAMGGTYATAAATSLDDAPLKARSFLSGLFFTAYAWGMVFAAIFWRAFQDTTHSWKALFWFSSGFPFLLIIWRLALPETRYFTRVLKAKELMKQDQIKAGTYVKPSFKTKWGAVKAMLKKDWLLFIYLVVLLAGTNYLTHASQDMYPTMLRVQLDFSKDAQTVAIVVVNLGAITGGLLSGTFMEVTGRRLAIIICCVIGGCFTYPAFMLQTTGGVLGGGFFLFFAVIGVWGVLPIHLSELSPPEARALVSGLAYQLGNLASAASSTIETRLSKMWPIEWNAQGEAIKYDYAKTIACFTGAVFIYTLIVTFAGPEKFHRDLSSPVMKVYIEKVIESEGDAEKEITSSGDTSEFASDASYSKQEVTQREN
jgi:SHS family lactate transporter-like MFS transporter